MIGSRRRYPDKAKTLPKIGRVLCFVDKKDAVLLSIDILNFLPVNFWFAPTFLKIKASGVIRLNYSLAYPNGIPVALPTFSI